MRSLSIGLLAELGATITSPGYLVRIALPGETLRLSTLGDISYDGEAWIAADVRVQGLSANERGDQTGRLVFANTWLDYGALMLNDALADRAVDIWAVYAGAPGDAVQVFSGAADEASMSDDGRLTVTLAGTSAGTAYWPSARINAASGFNHLIPAGTPINMAGQTYRLER